MSNDCIILAWSHFCIHLIRVHSFTSRNNYNNNRLTNKNTLNGLIWYTIISNMFSFIWMRKLCFSNNINIKNVIVSFKFNSEFHNFHINESFHSVINHVCKNMFSPKSKFAGFSKVIINCLHIVPCHLSKCIVELNDCYWDG